MIGDPWESEPIAPAPPAVGGPWEDYAPPPPRAPVRITVRPQGVEPQPGDEDSPSPQVSALEDVGKGAVGGLARGVTGLAGTFGTLGDAYHALANKVGVPENLITTGAALGKHMFGPLGLLMAGPSGSDIQNAVEKYTGKFYEPKTVPGQYASTLGEFAPGAIFGGGAGAGARVLNTVVPALASETAGQLTKGSVYEPWARGATALLSAPVAAKIITPLRPATPARQRAITTLENAIGPEHISAGERTGFKPFQWLESVAEDQPFSSAAATARREARQNAVDQYLTGQMFDPAQTRAAARRAGVALEEGAALPRPDVMRYGTDALGHEYDRIILPNRLRSDPTLHHDFHLAQHNYESNVLAGQRATGARNIEAIRNDIVDRLLANNGSLSGPEYKAFRERLGKQANSARSGQNADTQLADALDAMQGALDRAFRRGLSPADQAALRLNDQRYAIMKTLEPAIAKAQSGEHMSPAAVAQALRSGPRRSRYARAQGMVDEFGQAAANVFKPLPQSGTAPRAAYGNLLGLPTQMIGGAIAGGAMLGPPGAVGGFFAPLVPHLGLRAAVSGPGQAYLGNRALPQNLRDIMAQSLAQQFASQPSGIERNQAEQAAYAKRRQQELRARGLQ